MSGILIDESEVALPDGSAYFVTVGGDVAHLAAFDCQVCFDSIPIGERWNSYAFQALRPDAYGPAWLCPDCGYQYGGTPARGQR